MRTFKHTQSDFTARLQELIDRPAVPPGIEERVAEIIEAVAREGDAAISRYAREIDQVELTSENFTVQPREIKNSTEKVSSSLRRAIELAAAQIKQLARHRVPVAWRQSPRPGVELGETFHPLSRVGAYVPGGTAPLVSTVLHTAALASAAGVEEIILTTPPGPEGSVDPAILFAAMESGTEQVMRLGGVYGVAALALGTETVKNVEKIVGPGNAYVTAAKRQLYGRVALDMVAGPSEIMVIGDEQADPRWAAADMLSQIEHGSGHEQAVLASDSETWLRQVADEVEKQCAQLSRGDFIRQCLEQGVYLLCFPDLREAADFAGAYAPEHLELMCAGADEMASEIKAAGAIFIGPWTPEPVGDFVAGPSHVLPTAGAARFFSGLTVEQFFRRISVVKYEREALQRELPAITALAEAEGLSAHGRSAAIRFE